MAKLLYFSIFSRKTSFVYQLHMVNSVLQGDFLNLKSNKYNIKIVYIIEVNRVPSGVIFFCLNISDRNKQINWKLLQKNIRIPKVYSSDCSRFLIIRNFILLFRLLGFPLEFSFPDSSTRKQRYRTLGNSLNVHVVAVLTHYLLHGE